MAKVTHSQENGTLDVQRRTHGFMWVTELTEMIMNGGFLQSNINTIEKKLFFSNIGEKCKVKESKL